ncbi:CHAT domain-containing protein [Phormidesmis sp. 146-35]
MKPQQLTLALVSGAIICFVGVSSLSVGSVAIAQPPSSASTPSNEADRLFKQGTEQSQRGQSQEALKTFQRALAIVREMKDRSREAQILYAIGNTHFALQQYSEAVEAYQQALPLFRDQRNLLARDPNVSWIDVSIAQIHSQIGQIYSLIGEYAKSQTSFDQALALFQSVLEQAKASQDMKRLIRQNMLVSYGTLSISFLTQKQYEPALKYQQSALETARQLKDSKQEQASLELIVTIYALQGNAYQQQQKYESALESFQKGLKIAEANNFQRWQGMTLLAIGQIYVSRQDFTQGLKYQNQALAVAQQNKNRSVQIQVLFGRGAIYRKLSRYPEALADFQQAHDLLKTTGDSLGAASMLVPMGEIYAVQNQSEQSLNAWQQAEKSLENNPFAQFANGINANNVEQVCQLAQQVGATEGLFSLADNCASAYALGTEALKRPFVLEGLNSVLKDLNRSLLTLKGAILHSKGQLYLKQANYQQASVYYQKALPILRQVGSPIQGATLGDIGITYLLQGQYDQALNFTKHAVEVSRSFKHRINEEDALAYLAIAAWAQGNTALALETFKQKAIVENEGLSNNLIIGSEEQKRSFLDGKTRSIDLTVAFHLQSAPKNSEAARLAINTVLQRKGRILDAASNDLQRLRRNLKPEDQKLLNDLNIARVAYVNLFYDQSKTLTESDFKTQATTLKSRIDSLENALAQRSAEFRTQIQPVALEGIQAMIPANAALVEFVRYSPFNLKANRLSEVWKASRYAAAIMTRQGNPQWIDLGEAKSIEQTIEQFRDRLQDPSNSENRSRDQLARVLDRQVMQPIRKYLGNTKHILISPDGALNLIPFEALKDEQNQYLIERYAFSYLTSGRDLIRFAAAPPSRQAPVVFSEVDYDRANQVAVKPDSTYRSIDLASEKFAPLETAAETQQIKKAFPNAIVFRQQDATKTALQQIQAPLILHLATHGFFLPAQRKDEQEPISFRNNPLLRSGLILAGFNQHNSSANRTDKSVLTALEATGLDLYGTQLVVLSACETGLGDPSIGEGIYGLRRALVIAGSQSQVLSLWKVRDDATGILMQQFYDNLKAGKGRHEALRDAQLQLLRSPNYQNPHYWAAFVPSGNWTALPTK